jgi:Trp operon repressor
LIPYEATIEQEMRKFYNTLSEKDKGRYAAIEAMKLGHGGIAYIAGVLGCSSMTITRGIKDLESLPIDSEYDARIRQPGGGRKRYDEVYPDINQKFLDVLQNYTPGDPMQEDVLWTNLTPSEIACLLAEKHGICVSVTVIQQLLDKYNYHRRMAQKKETMKTVQDRNAQFENIARLKAEYEAAGNPIISFDTKKKEQLGNYYRPGHLYTREELHTYDHDFNSFADGVVIPHGICDVCQNRGYINIGISKDTSEFACDSLRNWWYHEGQHVYPQATSVLALCDGGGSNSSRHYIFKEDLQKLVDEIEVEIRISHYPPYSSKYNLIEHRMFPHVTRACQGVVFKSVELVKELMEKTKTSKGLTVTVRIIDKVYQTGRKAAADFKENMSIKFDELLPNRNYTAVPNP